MQVTEIKKAKGSMRHVFLDGEYAMSLPAQILFDFGIKEGFEADASFFEEAKEAADRRRAKERALYLLEYRDHSYGELVDKLCKSVPPEIAGWAADEMVRLGFLNDEAYGERLLHHLLTVRKYGLYRARQEMLRKKLDKALIDQLAADLEDDPISRLLDIIGKKYAGKLSDPKERQKAMNALARRGYDFDDIKSAVREYMEDEDN